MGGWARPPPRASWRHRDQFLGLLRRPRGLRPSRMDRHQRDNSAKPRLRSGTARELALGRGYFILRPYRSVTWRLPPSALPGPVGWWSPASRTARVTGPACPPLSAWPGLSLHGLDLRGRPWEIGDTLVDERRIGDHGEGLEVGLRTLTSAVPSWAPHGRSALTNAASGANYVAALASPRLKELSFG